MNVLSSRSRRAQWRLRMCVHVPDVRDAHHQSEYPIESNEGHSANNRRTHERAVQMIVPDCGVRLWMWRTNSIVIFATEKAVCTMCIYTLCFDIYF